MADSTSDILKCGIKAIEKNSTLNSFMEAERLTLSSEKSFVLHVGKHTKCKQSYPKLKVYKADMEQYDFTRYLRDIISSCGKAKQSVENRRNKGWGKMAAITRIASEMPDQHKIEIGMKMQDSNLINGLLYSTEAW